MTLNDNPKIQAALRGVLHELVTNSSGGGALPEYLEPQGIRAVAFFLDDGRVVAFDLEVPQ